MLLGCPVQVDFPARKATFHSRLPMGNSPGKSSASYLSVDFKFLQQAKFENCLSETEGKALIQDFFSSPTSFLVTVLQSAAKCDNNISQPRLAIRSFDPSQLESMKRVINY